MRNRKFLKSAARGSGGTSKNNLAWYSRILVYESKGTVMNLLHPTSLCGPTLVVLLVVTACATPGIEKSRGLTGGGLPPCPDIWEKFSWSNCYGTFTFANGGKYVGEWRDDKKHGQGTYTWAVGNKYVGEWKDGKRHGQGTFTYANGNKYVGEFSD